MFKPAQRREGGRLSLQPSQPVQGRFLRGWGCVFSSLGAGGRRGVCPRVGGNAQQAPGAWAAKLRLHCWAFAALWWHVRWQQAVAPLRLKSGSCIRSLVAWFIYSRDSNQNQRLLSSDAAPGAWKRLRSP